jgi:hypothetical protein
MKTFLTNKFSYFLISAWCLEQRLYCLVPGHAARSATTNRKLGISHVLKGDEKSEKIEDRAGQTDRQTETHVKGQTGRHAVIRKIGRDSERPTNSPDISIARQKKFSKVNHVWLTDSYY